MTTLDSIRKKRSRNICGCNNKNGTYRVFTQSGKSILSPYVYKCSDGSVMDLDSYAVFKYVGEKGSGFWQQASPWYMRYGNATRWIKNNCL